MKEKYIYPCVVYEQDGIYYANFKDFDACFTDGENIEEVIINAKDVLEGTIFSLLKNNLDIPEPTLTKPNLENNELEIWIDMRVPVKIKNEQIIETIKKNTEDFGYEFLLHSNTQPLYVPKDSFLVSTLMNIYKELTGDNDAEPVAIGGGTYAKYANNTVAFGALLPDQEDRMHQRDEYLEISKIDKLLQIYVEAIYKLAK